VIFIGLAAIGADIFEYDDDDDDDEVSLE